jgi:plastocyanin
MRRRRIFFTTMAVAMRRTSWRFKREKDSELKATTRNSIFLTVARAGMMKVVCDTHAWMLGFVHVFDHPLFACFIGLPSSNVAV